MHQAEPVGARRVGRAPSTIMLGDGALPVYQCRNHRITEHHQNHHPWCRGLYRRYANGAGCHHHDRGADRAEGLVELSALPHHPRLEASMRRCPGAHQMIAGKGAVLLGVGGAVFPINGQVLHQRRGHGQVALHDQRGPGINAGPGVAAGRRLAPITTRQRQSQEGQQRGGSWRQRHRPRR